MGVRLLGSVGVDTAGGFVEVEHAMQRAVFALLALAEGAVASDRLIDQLWDDDPPATARKSLQNHVSRLRRAIGADVVVTDGGGYRLAAPSQRVDALAVERLVGRAQQARADGRPLVAEGLLDEALAAWGGEPFPGCAPSRTLEDHATRLRETHRTAREERADLRLLAGEAEPVVEDMLRLTAEEPLRESAWALLVRAQAALGRQADALASYQRARTVLAEELGLDPGEELRTLERAVLQGDAARTPDAPAARRHRLPRPRSSFVGRGHEVTEVTKLVHDNPLVTLTGVGGSGKTRLALEAALQAADGFDDGAAFADLVPARDATRVWEAIHRALGAEAAGVGETARAAALRVGSGSDLLLVLDNCEHVVDEAAGALEELLDACPELHVLATSRRPLHVEGERVVRVPPLDVATEATQLLQERVVAGGAPRVDEDVARELCSRLDGLPLAIELAAARCRQLGGAEVAARLADRFDLLVGRRGRDGRQATLEAAIAWSHELLAGEEQALLAELSVLSVPFGADTAEGLSDQGDPVALLASLVDQSLVVVEVDGRFHLLDTIRAFARRTLDDDEAARLRERYVRWCADRLAGFDEPFGTMLGTRAADVLERETDGLLLATRWAWDAQDWPAVVEIAGRLLFASMEDPSALAPDVAAQALRAALDAGVDGELRERALAAHVLVDLSYRLPPREDLNAEALERLLDAGPLAAMPLALSGYQRSVLGRALGNDELAALGGRLQRRALELADASDLAHPNVQTAVALVHVMAGDVDEAVVRAEQAEDAFRMHPELVRGLPGYLTWVAVRWISGRPLPHAEVHRRAASVWALHRFPHVHLLLDAFADPSSRPRRSAVEIDQRRVLRQDPRVMAALLAATARLAADEGDPGLALELYAAARTAGPVWSTPLVIAQFARTRPDLVAAVPDDEVERREARGTDGGLPYGVERMARWLADVSG